MSLPSGTRLGPYEILSALGAGGMGEVYKARDTRLARSVAIKVLPPDTATDAAARARFEREARAIAALSHPHICVVHDVGHHEGTDYLVMELLDGETLGERLARAKGPLPLDEVLKIGTAIADALDKAHRAGIVHRDLKPANVMLTKSGPKLLDFGLAKLHDASPVALSDGTAATTVAPGTAHGTILGSIHYMAPEQVEGRPADARSDIWALGAVLYEMATGTRPFDGESAASVVGAIMQGTPVPLATRQPLTPPTFEYLVEKSLSKDPDARWQSVRDVGGQLAWLTTFSGSMKALPSAARVTASTSRVAWAVGAAAVLAVVAAVGLTTRESRPASRPLWLTLPPPHGRFGSWIAPEVSPDGRRIAFWAPGPSGTFSLWVRALDEPQAREVPGTNVADRPGSGDQQERQPAWSPDGSSLAVFVRSQLLRIDLDGSAPLVLASAPNPRGVTWGSSGVILYVPSTGAGINRVAASGGAAVRLPVDSAARFPSFLPDGQHFLFSTQGSAAPASGEPGTSDAGVFVASLGGGDVARLSELDGPAVSRVKYARRSLFFGRAGALFGLSFDPVSLRASGEPFRVAERLGWNSSAAGAYAFGVSEAGTVVYSDTPPLPRTQLTWFDRTGRVLGTVGDPWMCNGLALSPDATRVAQDCLDPRSVSYGVWIADVATGSRTLLANDRPDAVVPVWAADGRRVVYRVGQSLVVKSTESERSEVWPLEHLESAPWPEDWSPDGRSILFGVQAPATLYDLYVKPAGVQGAPEPFQRTAANESQARFSNDGRWLAFVSDESGQSEVYVQAFPRAGMKTRVSTAGGTQPAWRRDGRELFYLAPDGQLNAVSMTPSPVGLTPGAPQSLFRAPLVFSTPRRRQFAVSADGERLLLGTVVPAEAPPTLSVIVNWDAALHK